MVDTNGDGTLEIVERSSGLTVRDGRGEIISQNRPVPFISNFSLCHWPGKNDRAYVLMSDDNTTWILDFEGKTVAQLEAPKAHRGMARGVPVKLKADQPEYFAVLVELQFYWRRSILYIYNPNHKLVYQEILPETCGAIAALPLDRSGTDALLVGGWGKVWQYQIRNAAGNRR